MQSFMYFFKLMQPLTYFYSSVTVKENGGKPDRKAYPFPNGLRNPYRNLKSENSNDYAQKLQQNLKFLTEARHVYFCYILISK
jgi:hypothetical protein